ncbi:MAG: cellulase family glycosylhydrolase [Sedimentisphaerales bacterium]|nr:cellulase family glycosylhydrolase [Sedimentisphaerales bacterium]
MNCGLYISRFLAVCIWMLALGQSAFAGEILKDEFERANLDAWRIREGDWTVRNGRAVAEGGFSVLLNRQGEFRDVEVTADVAYSYEKTHAAAGIVFRFRDDFTGYGACLREVEKGFDQRFGPWERPVLQLYRLDKGRFKLLQESKVIGCRSDLLRRLKVICKGPNIWVFYEDMTRPILTEYDDCYDRPAAAGLWKDHHGKGIFDNFTISPVISTPPAPLRTDFSDVRGAVYIRSNAVNSVQMWHDYWDHTAVIDRELSYAGLYGFNMVQAYLHWIVYDRHSRDYLRRIDDFLARADKYGLKVNFILWDDCGHVEPTLNFADPIPGRHNSQMMPNPSHKIRNSESQMSAHKEKFRDYIESVAARFRNDDRIAFWQLYNECMGPKEQYRSGKADANLNRLLTWTRQWVKAAGTRIPVTATGGAFYGPAYSDFYSYHSYSSGGAPLPNADAGPEHLCTETLNRPDSNLIDCLEDLAGKDNGFVVWELMIGRDNCRYPWGHPDGLAEPAEPFHGVIYPDGHPWDVNEIAALLGRARFDALQTRLFEVEYFTGRFEKLVKQSVTPRIDFDLGDEPGAGSPDASAGIGIDDFSIRWTGRLVPERTGDYTFFADCDGLLSLWINGDRVIEKTDHARREVQGEIRLPENKDCEIRIDYYHKEGPSSNHIRFSGPDMPKRPLFIGSQ